ncbi:hypothetical protein HZY86_01305 [Aerococcaceae bacterium DSM 111020]|nr:hypothetical protein [Aerococcaceae bacterium DSM 111020]
MKTPHTVELYFNEDVHPTYDPVTNTYVSEQEEPRIVNAFVNKLSSTQMAGERVTELYGARSRLVVSVRVLQQSDLFKDGKPFVKAVVHAPYIDGLPFVRVDRIDAMTKGAVRLVEVEE